MSDVLEQYPSVQSYLDDSESFQNSAQEVVSQDKSTYLIVTQVGQTTAGQLLFSIAKDGTLTFIRGDTLVSPQVDIKIANVRPGSYVASSASDHAKVASEMVAEDGKFSSADGPDHGNLACVWTMRQIVQLALNREITQTDSTNTFVDELTSGFKAKDGFDKSDVLAGGIIISPGALLPASQKWRHGHVGLMAEQVDGVRKVYSNSSTEALWIENGTVDSWLEVHKGLKTYFFPIPLVE